MTKRRSSIRGRGAEILFGDPSSVEVEPRGPDGTPLESDLTDLESVVESVVDAMDEASIPSPESEPLVDDEELELALLAEAQAGEPSPEEDAPDFSALLDEELPTPEEEVALFEEAVAAEDPPEPEVEAPAPPVVVIIEKPKPLEVPTVYQPPAPVVEAPAPTLEVSMEDQKPQEEAAVHQPPPSPSPEDGQVAADLLPERPVTGYFDMGETAPLAAHDIQTTEGVEKLELPERELTEEEKKALLRRWGSARLQELNVEISKTYDHVLSRVGENENIATDCYNQLLKARDIVIRREADRIPQAEYYISQVRARVKRAVDSENGARKYAWWITAWGFLWGTLFLGGLIALNIADISMLTNYVDALQLFEVQTFLSAMIWGGIGGVVAVWYSLFKHVGLRDFDTQYNLSYVGKPFLGMVLGATVFMLFQLMLSLRILPVGLQADDGSGINAVTPWIIYPVAWACGFKENRIFDLVDRVMKRIFSTKDDEEEAAPAAEPAEPAG